MNEESPATTLGILGGGQLGRMSAQAAAKLGIDVVIFTPEKNSPASQVAHKTIVAPYDDHDALTRFAAQIDVISYEFENIPVATIQFLKKLTPVFPDDNLLEIAQDRLVEKEFLNTHGIPTAQFAPAISPDEILSALKTWGATKCIIKTTRFGYDGKGQAFIDISGEKSDEGSRKVICNAWGNLNSDIVIIEALVDFECEVSVIVARDHKGAMETYGPCLNEHSNHILSRTIIPAPIHADLSQRAIEAAKNLAKALNLTGVMALELFVTKTGQILANEIAPRTHNSGHWSIDACAISQFENHVRTVCGLDVGAPDRHSDCEMLNLIGNEVEDAERKYAAHSGSFVHLYGKSNIRDGRKMGHVTILKSKE